MAQVQVKLISKEVLSKFIRWEKTKFLKESGIEIFEGGERLHIPVFDNSLKIGRLIGTSFKKWCFETIGGTESGTAVADKDMKFVVRLK